MKATLLRLTKALEGTGVQVEEFVARNGVLTLDTDDWHISIVALGSELDVEVEKR